MPGIAGRSLLPAVGLCSFAALLLELALTRLFSVVLFYHFAFLAISIALLGLGSGGVFAHALSGPLARWRTRELGLGICLLGALAMLVALTVALQTPFSLRLDSASFVRLAALYLAAAVPFFLTGLLLSLVFAREAPRIPELYAADLAGGGLACLAVVPLLDVLGAPNAVIVASAAMAVSGGLWAANERGRLVALALAGGAVALVAANRSGRLLDVGYAKGGRPRPEEVLFARWNAISRVEVVSDAKGAASILIDGDARSDIVAVAPDAWRGTAWEPYLMATPAALANVLRPRGDFAIIGPGGGADVLRAVGNGSRSVLAIEINPLIADTLMRGLFADHSRRLYERPGVRIQVGDGRSILRACAERFDVVQMTMVDTWASTAAGALALSENSLYTVEAFQEYFEHLKPDGLLAVTRWEFKQPREALRVLAVAIEALRGRGVSDTRRHFIVVGDGPLDEDGQAVTVLAKLSPFDEKEEELALGHLEAHPGLAAVYSPSSPGSSAFAALALGGDAWAFAERYGHNVAPATDDRPFFFFTLKTGRVLRELTSPGAATSDWKNNFALVALVFLLVLSTAAVGGFLILPLLARSRVAAAPGTAGLYFVAVGLGYILVEIALIQRFVLYLGHPTYALTVVVFALLLSSAGGSFVLRGSIRRPAALRGALAATVGLALVYVAVLPALLDASVGLAYPAKLSISAGLLVPLGFAMGIPFPFGLHRLAAAGTQRGPVEWAWALNAGSSVLGSVVAMVVAIHFGLGATLAAGAAAYAAAGVLTPHEREYPQ